MSAPPPNTEAAPLQTYNSGYVPLWWYATGYTFDKVVNNTLCLQVFDYDRLSKDDVIGEVVIPLTPSDLVNELTVWKELQPSHGSTVGTITFIR